MLDLFHEIPDRLYNPRLPTLQNTDGDPLSLHKLVFDLNAVPQAAFDALKHLALDELDEDLLADATRELPALKRELQLNELQAASDAGVDALVAVYHSDHRELCAHERDWPFRIINILEVIGESMGLHHHDRFKQLKVMQDADQIVAECRDLIVRHALDAETARDVVVKAMLGDQPLPLKGGSRQTELSPRDLPPA